MILSIYQHLPLNINPIAFRIGFFALRWYSLAYILGLFSIWAVLQYRIYKCELIKDSQLSKKDQSSILSDLILVTFFSGLVGGRLGYVLFYNLVFYLKHPLQIFLPFDQWGGYQGIYGMSYHGAIVAAFLGGWAFSRWKKLNFWKWADFVVVAVPLGYFWGRVGNFLNGELYGRVTNLPVGMYFASDPFHLRHPSQFYDGMLAGLILFIILWKFRKKDFLPGTLLAFYLIGYGILRFVAEFFRQPDSQLGFVLGNFTMGQLLSIALIASGIIILFWKKCKKVV